MFVNFFLELENQGRVDLNRANLPTRMSKRRSRPAPVIRDTDKSDTEIEDENTAFPTVPQEPVTDPRVPSWIQELANARSGRNSRASSVVSTRTRFSTTTFDDARSIDIQAGGQTFRISRRGDRVTDTSAPPPYSEPDEDEEDYILPSHEHLDPQHTDKDNGRPHGRIPNHGRFRGGLGGRARGGGGRRGERRVRIAMPDHEGTKNTHEDDSMAADTPSRELSVEEMRQIILDLPARLKSVLGIDIETSERDNISVIELNESTASVPSSHKDSETNPSATESNSRSAHEKHIGSSWKRGILRNAPTHAPYHTDSALLDRGEYRWTPPDDGTDDGVHNPPDLHDDYSSIERATTDIDESQDPYGSSDTITFEHGEVMVPPTVGDINELSQVYNKVIRDLDREHRRQLHNRDKEMDTLRVLLHEKDIIYRQQLKGKDFIIDDLKRRLDQFEETLELQMERARNQVEDLWESRWKEHQSQLMEKLALIKPALQPDSTSMTHTDDSGLVKI